MNNFLLVFAQKEDRWKSTLKEDLTSRGANVEITDSIEKALKRLNSDDLPKVDHIISGTLDSNPERFVFEPLINKGADVAVITGYRTEKWWSEQAKTRGWTGFSIALKENFTLIEGYEEKFYAHYGLPGALLPRKKEAM